MAMKWSELPTDAVALKELYAKLKDKEMRLEADLAIKDHPEVEACVTKLALALADVKKLDLDIGKIATPESESRKKELDALMLRAEHLRRQLKIVEDQIEEFGGKVMEKLGTLRSNRAKSFEQLREVYGETSRIFGEFGFNLDAVIPSIMDFIKSTKG